MSDDCPHSKARVTVDTEDGPRQVCPICDDVDLTTLD